MKLGERDVRVAARLCSFSFVEFARPHRCDQRPVSADGAPLVAPPAQPDRFERDAWEPEGREKMAMSAADDQPRSFIASGSAATLAIPTSHRRRCFLRVRRIILLLPLSPYL